MKNAATTTGRAEDAADMLARDIHSGHFGLGTWLKQIDLEKRYGCTRIEVRRALDKLVAKRLVQHIPNRGYHVYQPDQRQTDEIRDVRVVLETAAADSIVEAADAAAIAELQALAQRFAELVLDGTLLEQYEANIAFHTRLARLCTNRELGNLILEFRGRGPSAPLEQWKTRARVEQSAREHFLMIDAIAARDADALKRIIRAHIRQTAEGMG
ncbi:GntR family transcriptional regulator [Aliidongia dinghuensis]|uniref:GntR family transcriptional regulator n=1 Tax=Aliidongia dinghuensis TaxID=1867774 RepID=A0A8J2YYG7_9PROT|nr:GntR family transcriptional regulator [Aliidongia dinghuensis]GGF38432.1 GntR family transcriptional regulator [Aliidongia dinghuensis]